MGQTIAEINAEIARWVAQIDEQDKEIERLEAQRTKLGPNGALLFRDIPKFNALGEKLRSARIKREAADLEMRRLRAAHDEAMRQIAELERSRSVYEKQLRPHGIDWSRVDPAVDRAAHLDELRDKLTRVDAEIGVRYGNVA